MSKITEVPSPWELMSSVRWSRSGDGFVVGCWDGNMHVWGDGAVLPIQHEDEYIYAGSIPADGPVLDVCHDPNGRGFFAVGVNQDVARYQMPENEWVKTVLSRHSKASNKIAYSKEHDMLISTSWDCTMHLHDVTNNTYVPVQLAAKPTSISLTADKLVVAMIDRKVHVYDLAALRLLISQNADNPPLQEPLTVEPWQQRESNLKFQTRAITCMPDGTGFASSSIEGRVSVEWFDPAKEKDTYAFKCHRVKLDLAPPPEEAHKPNREGEMIYPVNAIAFHPVHGTFATGGGDGGVCVWDAKSKRRIKQYPKVEGPVVALDFNPDGSKLVIVTSSQPCQPANLSTGLPMYSPEIMKQLEEATYQPSECRVYVREFTSDECKAKAKEAKQK